MTCPRFVFGAIFTRTYRIFISAIIVCIIVTRGQADCTYVNRAKKAYDKAHYRTATMELYKHKQKHKKCDDKGWSVSFLRNIQKLSQSNPREAIQAYAWLRERLRQGDNHTNINKLCEYDNLIGTAYFKLKDYKNASSYLKKSTCLNANLAWTLGVSYFRAKDFKDAYNTFKQIQYSEKIPKIWEECQRTNCHISTKKLCEYSQYCKYKNKAFDDICQDTCLQKKPKPQIKLKTQPKQIIPFPTQALKTPPETNNTNTPNSMILVE